MNKPDVNEATTTIHIGDRVVVHCGIVGTHAARLWSLEFDGEPVAGLVDLGMDGSAQGVGIRWAVFDEREDPNDDALEYLAAHGWQIIVGAGILRVDQPHVRDFERPKLQAFADRAWAAWWFGTKRDHPPIGANE